MASSITPTKFQIKLKEEHVVKGIKTLNETFFTLGSITNVDRRIVSITGSTNINLFDVNGINISAGTFRSSSMKYARITNLDDTYNLAVSFTSSKAPDGQGVNGTDIVDSLTSGGIGGIVGKYLAVPTTASDDTSITGSGMTLDITISSSLDNSDALSINTNATNCGIGNSWTFVTPLTGGSGTKATASVVIDNTDLTAPTVSTVTVSASDAYGYLVDDVLQIAAGDLGTGQLTNGIAFTNNGLIPTVTNNVSRTFAIHTTTGYGGTATVVAAGGVISTVTPVNIGTGYVGGQLVTISQQELTNQGFGTVNTDYTSTLVGGNVQDSSQVTLTALASLNISSAITEALINVGGSGYEVGEELTVSGDYIGGATEPTFTLVASDFTENGPRSYWSMNLLPTSSLMFSSPEVTGSHFNGFWDQDLEFVSVMSNATDKLVDVEYVVVNSDNANS